MTITADQPLLKILRDDESARERLLSLLGPDSALADLIVQDVVPARLRVGEAARMAGIPLERFAAVLNGDLCPASEPAPPPTQKPPAPKPVSPTAPISQNDWFAQAEAVGAVHLDVRPILESGRDPFADVMRVTGDVPPDGFLIVDAPFDPAPLRRVLAGKGFTSVGRLVEPGHWRICFRRALCAPAAQPAMTMPGETWREGNVVHIDVRGMVPPGPLNAILKLVESGEAPAIMAHLDRDPLPLYAELESLGWDCVAKQKHGNEVRLILRPKGAA
ncbi:DUF2249 domain-containing protein [Azospirillum sp. sgz302134]